jgi:YegS/Rv2252/BmrU family lipid kinase
VDLGREAAAAGAELVLAIGGDGTVRDVVEGLGASAATLAIIPAGTGNDLIRSIGVPRRLGDALDVAVNGAVTELDLWSWNDRPFLNVSGVGFDAAVAETSNRRFRWMRGTPAYLAATIATLPDFSPFELEVAWPGGKWKGNAWLAAFGNGAYYGGGMRIVPAADPSDGLLDAVVVEAMPRAVLLAQFARVFAGTHVRHPKVRTFRAAQFQVSAPPMRATIDGELIGTTPASLRLLRRIRVKVPRQVQGRSAT